MSVPSRTLSFRFNGWTGWDRLLGLLSERRQAETVARRVWPGIDRTAVNLCVWMPGGPYRITTAGARRATADERQAGVLAGP